MEGPLYLPELRQSIVVSGLTLLLVTAFVISTAFFDKSPSLKAARWGDSIGTKARQNALLTSSKSIYLENYWKDSAFGQTEKLVVPPKYLDELRRLPHSILSFEDAHSESPVTKYTDTPPPKFFRIVPHVTKARLTPSLTRLVPTLSAEADQIIPLELGQCKEWTPVNIHHRIMRIIAVLAGRVFIGPELCHDERYIDAAINYTIEFSKASQDIEGLSPWLRPFVARRVRSVIALREREHSFVAFLTPIIHARRKASDEGQRLPDDMLTWLMEEPARDNSAVDIRHIARTQLALFAVAFHTTALTATNVFYDHAVNRNSGGVLTSASLQRLVKLDSFMKESLRFHPLSIATFQRRVLTPFTLSDGHYVPKHIIIEVATHAITRDPEFFPDPEVFHPWRFTGTRDEGRNQFASISGMLGTFGFGPHACPGRFFAAVVLKIVIANIIMGYDVGIPMKEGEVGERYKNLDFGLMSNPDTSKAILLKRADEGDV
ncbi:cytochrome P450 [Aspergillus oleicola]